MDESKFKKITLSLRPGTYLSKSVKLKETAINGTVVRVCLDELNTDDQSPAPLGPSRTSKIMVSRRGRPPHFRSMVQRALERSYDDSLPFRQYCKSKLFETHYRLKLPRIYKSPVNGKLTYDLNKLLTKVKLVKLPGPSWKVRVLFQSNSILSISFTNKQTVERCVAFHRSSDVFRVTIDNRPAVLLACPVTIDNVDDLGILLNIVNSIDADDPTIFYVKDK